jgi:hypothetical protein
VLIFRKNNNCSFRAIDSMRHDALYMQLRAEEIWQERWTCSDKGRATYASFPNVTTEQDQLPDLTFARTQVNSGVISEELGRKKMTHARHAREYVMILDTASWTAPDTWGPRSSSTKNSGPGPQHSQISPTHLENAIIFNILSRSDTSLDND